MSASTATLLGPLHPTAQYRYESAHLKIDVVGRTLTITDPRWPGEREVYRAGHHPLLDECWWVVDDVQQLPQDDDSARLIDGLWSDPDVLDFAQNWVVALRGPCCRCADGEEVES